MPDTPTLDSVYRMRRGYFARALGRLLIVASAAVTLTVLALQWLPGVFGVVGVVISAITLVAAAFTAISLMMPPALLQLDDEGFRAHKRQVAGPARANWDAVSSVSTQEGEHGPLLIVQHATGQHTAVPLALLDASVDAVEADVRRRLDTAHGYKRLS